MNASPRKPWLAAVFALLCPGLGHLYCGRIGRGIAFAALSLASAPAAVIVAGSSPRGGLLATLSALCAISIAVDVFAIVDAWRIARVLPADFVPRTYQRPAIYALFVAAGVICPAGSAALIEHGALASYKIAARSMEPTLLAGDRVLANKLSYALGPVRRGDIVVFAAPGMPNVVYAKRVVGLPGDRIAVKDGFAVVNGAPLLDDASPAGADGERVERSDGRSWRVHATAGPPDVAETLLPEDGYYVLGDHRDTSLDSRRFGPVSRSAIFGRVEYVWWSPGGWARIRALGDDQ